MFSAKIFLLTLSYVASLLTFQAGILTRRRVLTSRGSCAGSNTSYCLESSSPEYGQVVLLIIDALRYDFIEPVEELLESNYRGQMPNVASLLRNSSEIARLFPLIADDPTTTFQRIKAIITGTIPAFIEAGDNFGGNEISEDNLVEQLTSVNKTVVLLGDETWLQLMPKKFQRHFTAPSFDIMDLDGVDKVVTEKISDELNRTDWSFLIAHCLGVDHCGHRFNANHSEMKRKLREMDDLIASVIAQISDDTLLLVFV